MSMLWSFSPFIAFALLSRFVPVTVALFTGAAVAAWLMVRDRIRHARSLKILEVGTVVLFGGLGLYVLGRGGDWSIMEVRLAVDGGLFAIVLISMLIGQPFTLQYAREQVSPATTQSARVWRSQSEARSPRPSSPATHPTLPVEGGLLQA